MKRIMMFSMVLLATLSLGVLVMVSSKEHKPTSQLLFSRVEALADPECNKAGGPGATSCSCQSGTVSGGTGGSSIGGGGDSCSVTVGTGYYACCYKDSYGLCRCVSKKS